MKRCGFCFLFHPIPAKGSPSEKRNFLFSNPGWSEFFGEVSDKNNLFQPIFYRFDRNKELTYNVVSQKIKSRSMNNGLFCKKVGTKKKKKKKKKPLRI
ncbi:hypothetical protein DLM78_11425 [Leptospira stimsonii]|uniref:Uncharacterized protein n=1 Tax=Leptospira stimsonii TaxID=2202203 RepID=A0A8B3CQH9_9LEPT|nr:hypothetical protein DLM78_11425 [Leptospira stimsonii]